VKVDVPDGAFYVWPDVSAHFGKSFRGQSVKNSSDFAAALLEDQMVASVPGIEFGLEGHLRLSYALAKERMGEAVERLQLFISQLQ
jgi:aspartate aminotransferase